MSYHIYSTEAIVLKRTTLGEANILLHILTESFGLIITSAQSARLLQSKLRGALQEYSDVYISCIKSKKGWKATNVSEHQNFFFEYPLYTRKVLAQISFILLKMITGESPHPEIFQTVKSGFQFLKNIHEKDIPNFETLMVLRLLYQLGYVVSHSMTEIYIKNTIEWNDSILKKIEENKKVLIGLINKALKASHL